MIASLTGIVVAAHAGGSVLLRSGPVLVELTLPAVQAHDLVVGEEAELYTYLHVSFSADTIRLFGFTGELARDLFATLLTGPGVGPKVALALLELGAEVLVNAVREGDEQVLTSVSGVGPKLAKKIILELGEKVAKEFAAVVAAAAGGAGRFSAEVADALDAVIALGYARAHAEAALARVRRDYDGDDTSTLIRRMLALLAR